MRKLNLIIILGILTFVGVVFLVLSPRNSQTPSNITSPSEQNTIIFPKGGETFNQGQKITVQWNGGPTQTELFLTDTALATAGASVSIVDRVYHISNTGSFSYTFPEFLDDGTYTITIGSYTSQPFTVGEAQELSFCTASNVKASISLEPGAGNIYGALSLTNTSNTPCQIQGNKYVSASYQSSTISLEQQGPQGPNSLILKPNQSVYSTVRYPNGPQCSSSIQNSQISFSYQISPTVSVTFQNQSGGIEQSITTCSNQSDQTTVQIQSISQNNPLTN